MQESQEKSGKGTETMWKRWWQLSKRSSSASSQQNTGASSTSPGSEDDTSRVLCPCCGEGDESRFWVQCDHCQAWYHVECTDIDPDDLEKQLLGSVIIDCLSVFFFCHT